MKKTTIFDVAKRAGVGKSTVSRVLNNDENVKKETKEKILKVIKEMNYIPSASARGMRSNNSRVIGIITSRLDSPSETRAVRGMLEVIYSKGYDVVLVESLLDPKKTREHVEVLINKKVEGIIIFAISGLAYDYLKNIKIPVVMVAQAVEGFTSIVYDDYGAINKSVQYFYNMGLKNIAYLGLDLSDKTTGYNRYKAYEDFIKEHELPNISFFSDFSYKNAYSLTEKILEKPGIEAVVCATDNLALGVRKYLAEKGLFDIKVSGVGNNELIQFLFDKHISINLSYKQSGVEAGKALFELLQGKKEKEIITMNSILTRN